jgi:molybdopterin-containing oxidoreductase family iron-sulfur binding subunit
MEGREIIRETTLGEYLEDSKSGNEFHFKVAEESTTLYPTPKFADHHWGLAIDMNSCTGCSACVIACQAENNVAVIGKLEVSHRRIMHWIRLDRYYEGDPENPTVLQQPVMCQHCDNAPCENVCPVAATPHSSEGLNQMVYNRCIGTRYCMNNCPYRVRRFNWFEYTKEERFDFNMSNDLGRMQLNPDVVVRSRGVVEKCSLCVQRIQDHKLTAKMENRELRDGEIKTACMQSCASDAIQFGDLNDKESKVFRWMTDDRNYQLLEELHTLPSVGYLTKVRNTEKGEKSANEHHA